MGNMDNAFRPEQQDVKDRQLSNLRMTVSDPQYFAGASKDIFRQNADMTEGFPNVTINNNYYGGDRDTQGASLGWGGALNWNGGFSGNGNNEGASLNWNGGLNNEGASLNWNGGLENEGASLNWNGGLKNEGASLNWNGGLDNTSLNWNGGLSNTSLNWNGQLANANANESVNWNGNVTNNSANGWEGGGCGNAGGGGGTALNWNGNWNNTGGGCGAGCGTNAALGWGGALNWNGGYDSTGGGCGGAMGGNSLLSSVLDSAASQSDLQLAASVDADLAAGNMAGVQSLAGQFDNIDAGTSEGNAEGKVITSALIGQFMQQEGMGNAWDQGDPTTENDTLDFSFTPGFAQYLAENETGGGCGNNGGGCGNNGGGCGNNWA